MDSRDDLVSGWSEESGSSGLQKFIYLGGAIEGHTDRVNQADTSLSSVRVDVDARVSPLSTKQVGDRVRIVSLNCGEANNRLMGMGFMPDVVLQVISCTATGSVIVALQDQRLGLGADMAKRIQVMDAEQPFDRHQTTHTARSTTMPSTPEISTLKLREAAIGSRLRVIGYEPVARDYKRKLLAMGLTPGTELRVTRHAPLGDPTEIEVRNFHLSLRKDEADALIVESI